jgi:tetratricopeptide (TPR) repeat protein
MIALAEAWESAKRLYASANFRQAQEICQHIVRQDATHAEAWLMLGETCEAQGKSAEALAHYQTAVRLQPNYAEAHFRLGNTLAEQGERGQAIEAYRHTLRIKPDHAEALSNLGVTLAQLGQLEEAVDKLRTAISFRPDSAKAHHNLGVALAQQGKPDEAVNCFRQALGLKPNYPEAYYNLGNVLVALKKNEEAVACFQEALQRKPDYGEVFNNLGLLLTEMGQLASAVVFLQQAVRLRSQSAEAHNNLGLALAEQGRYAEAEACYLRALAINPNYGDAHANLGGTFRELGKLEEALACYQLALWLNPNSASTRWNRALLLLQIGNFKEGWAEYEWRWKRPKAPVYGGLRRSFTKPVWDGTPLGGRTILLHMEQGLGDMIHFIRYASLVHQAGGRVIVECPGFMIPLFSSCPGIHELVAEGSPLPDFDTHCPILSLPRLLGTTLETIPAQVPYLFADEGLIEHWRQQLSPFRAFKVGIIWQGNPHHRWDRHRSVPLTQFEPLARLAAVELFSLQWGPGKDQLRSVADRFSVHQLAEELNATTGAFMDTAAVMVNLDLVITVDTAAAHLAGALGVPVWVALSTLLDWRWLYGREDSPWYPTMRLFQQTQMDNWAPVLDRMAAEIRQILGKRLRGTSIPIAT